MIVVLSLLFGATPGTPLFILVLVVLLLVLCIVVLLAPLLLVVHGKLCLGNAVGKDPSFACTSAIGECFVLGHHTDSFNFVSIVLIHFWVMSFLCVWVMVSVVVYIITKCVTIPKVKVFFGSVAKCRTWIAAASVISVSPCIITVSITTALLVI